MVTRQGVLRLLQGGRPGASDLLNGNANPLGEAIHIVEFAGLVCLWVISGGPSRVPRQIAAISAWLPTRSPQRDFRTSEDATATIPRSLPRR